MKIKLERNERVLTAYAESKGGRCLVWAIIANEATGTFREVAIQPQEQSLKLHHLRYIAAEVHREMKGAIYQKMTATQSSTTLTRGNTRVTQH